MRYRSLLLDLDGTLLDSAPLIRAGLRAALAGVAVPVPDDAALSACIGLPLPHVWRRLGVPVGADDAAIAAYRAWSHSGGQNEAQPFPGVPELLRDLHAAGVVLVLASAKDTASAGRAVERAGWRPWFRHVSGCEPGDGPDKRALVARGLAMLTPDERTSVAMVGDMPLDGDAALVAGVPFVAVGWGCGVAEELAACRPEASVATMDALRSWLFTRP